ncbi:MAG: xanthan lyase, partial [Bacteroides sp.]|nr:xanthan lyase [Bacteroides sp.]
MRKLILTSLWLLYGILLPAQDIEQNVEERLQRFFKEYTTRAVDIGTCKLDSFRIDFRKKRLLVYANERFAYQPLRPENVEAIYRHLKQILPGPVNYFSLTLLANGKSIEELIPNLYRKGKKDKARLFGNLDYKGAPWVTRASRPYEVTHGLQGRHIALWQSHGNYYINRKEQWGWQRPRLFCTTEDQFTQSFVLPYLLPMLENAGACVFTPRERDTQKQEVIVDNDGHPAGENSFYLEVKSRKARWEPTTRPGFAQRKRIYQDHENPFLTGT